MFRYASDEKLRQELLKDIQEEMNKEIHNRSSPHDSRLKQVSVITF